MEIDRVVFALAHIVKRLIVARTHIYTHTHADTRASLNQQRHHNRNINNNNNNNTATSVSTKSNNIKCDEKAIMPLLQLLLLAEKYAHIHTHINIYI